jgi:hypothetical protein
MTISQTLDLDISDIGHAGFLDVVGELLEFTTAAEEVGVADVEFVDLGGVEDHLWGWDG